MTVKKLKVTSVKYTSVRRGIQYECNTNVKGVKIWNDGDGGATYISNDNSDYYDYHHLTEWDLEDLINQYEIKNQVDKVYY